MATLDPQNALARLKGTPRELVALLGCFHPSQQNTFTGVLTAEMIDAVLLRARKIGGLSTF